MAAQYVLGHDGHDQAKLAAIDALVFVLARQVRAACEQADEIAHGLMSSIGQRVRRSIERCDMNTPPLTPIERALVTALVSAIVKELQLESQTARTPAA